MPRSPEHIHQQKIADRLQARNKGFTTFKPGSDQTIPELFDQQAHLHACKAAIAGASGSIIYGELERLSHDIGWAIRRTSVDRKPAVAVLIARHTTFVASILGVLRAGGFYIPLDPAFPVSRNSQILQESGVHLILTERIHQALVENITSRQKVIYVDEIDRDQKNLPTYCKPDDLAYVIYTSGSTGRPKGVMQTQRNLLQVVKRYTNSMYLGHKDRYSLLSSCSVTAAAGAIMSSVLNGATLSAFSVLEGGLESLAQWLEDDRITIYHSVPSLFRHLMKSVKRDKVFTHVELVRVGGDSLYASDWKLFTEHFTSRSVMVQFYGCSEVSSVSRFYLDHESSPAAGAVPTGYPLDGVEIYLRGTDGVERQIQEHMEVGYESIPIGEIILKSDYLSPGYWKNGDQDANADYSSATQDRVRTYSTGDLGTYRPGEGLIHMGREDMQVKLSGFRVEIAEIEACLRSCTSIREVTVLACVAPHGEPELVAFVEMDKNAEVGVDIKSYARDRLPTHMMPSEIVSVESMPLTPNGKTDRSTLMRMREISRLTKVKDLARSETEETLIDIWKRVLKVNNLGVEDNFFELSGNSLLAMKICVEVAERFGVRVSALAVYKYPTVRQISQLIEGQLVRLPQQAGQDHVEIDEGTL